MKRSRRNARRAVVRRPRAARGKGAAPAVAGEPGGALRPVALVTGSTRGIGVAIALRLARDGYAIVLNYRRKLGSARRTLARVQRLSPRSIALRADVSLSSHCERLVRETLERFGRLDVLVNNVGPFQSHDFVGLSEAGWRRMLEGNLSGAAHLMRHALRRMRLQRGGSIVNVGALHADASPGAPIEAPAYYAAKAGLMMLTRTLARTEGRYGVRVNAVSPGFIETENYASLPKRLRAVWERSIPLGRFGVPQDVAEAVAYLVSERGRYVSGAVLHVDGGLWV